MLLLLKQMIAADIPWLHLFTVDCDTFLVKALLFCLTLSKQMKFCTTTAYVRNICSEFWQETDFYLRIVVQQCIWGGKIKKKPELMPKYSSLIHYNRTEFQIFLQILVVFSFHYICKNLIGCNCFYIFSVSFLIPL